MSAQFQSFLENLTLRGLEYFKKYYGVYRGLVTDNKDPATALDPGQRGRIKVRVPQLGQLVAPNVWVDPAFNGSRKGAGEFWPPEVGDTVWVSFSNGDASRPNVYWGGWYGGSELPSQLGYATDGTPKRRGWVSNANHSLVFNDESGKEAVELKWKGGSAFITINASGDLTLQNKNGDAVTLQGGVITAKDGTSGSTIVVDGKQQAVTVTDAAGDTVRVAPAGITIQHSASIVINAPAVTISGPSIALGGNGTAISPVPKGDLLLTWLASHIHGTGVGPTSPPVVPPPPTMLSIVTKTA